MLTKAVRQYLETLGLAADASESDARQFMLTLEGPQLDMCQTLMGARAQDDEDDDEDRRDEDEQLDDEEDDDEDEQLDDEEDDDEDEDDEDRPSARRRRNRRRRNQDEDEDDEDKKQHALRRAYKHVADVTGIAQTFGLPKRWATRMLNNLSSGRMNMTQVRAAALKQLARRNQPLKTNTPPFGSRIQVGADRNLDTLGTAIHDAIMMRLGADIPEMDDFGQVVVQTEQQTRSGLQRAVKTRQPHARARQFRGQPLHAMARSYLQGLGVNTEGMTPVEVSQLVFNTRKLMSLVGMQAITHTTSDFPAILENIATKRLQQAYIEAPRTWPMFCRRAYAPDFKDVSVAQLDVMATLRKVNEGAEIKHVTIADSGQRYRLETFAEIFTLTWQALVNDDLRVFQRLPQMMGNAATRVEEELVYSIINSNQLPDGSPIFHADNGNLITGAPSGAPSVDQLNAAYAAMARQTSLDGQTELDITPAFLVVPVELRGIALELVTTQVKPGTNDPGGVANIWQGELQPIASPRLSRNSTDVWYLFADPNQIATIEVMFLESEPVPVIEEEESFNSLGRKYRVRHSVAAAAVDHRGMLRNDNNA